jgi:transposase InsO family protein
VRTILSILIYLLALRFRRRKSLELEVIALRYQIAVFKRRLPARRAPLITSPDRLIWDCFYRIYPRAKYWMQVVKPQTVVEWHRRGFLFYWRRRCAHNLAPSEVKDQLSRLIFHLYDENSGWGITRIRAELLKFGYDIDGGSVARSLLGRFRRYPIVREPAWKIFLRNHMHDTAAIDMFVVVTLSFKLLYGLVIISHNRRKILHFDATEHPTQEWLAKNILGAFKKNSRPKYLIRDRDRCYGQKFSRQLQELGIRERVIPKQSPWANAIVERLIGSIRRECLNYVIILDRRHLLRVLGEYVEYYNHNRTHRSLGKDCPIPRVNQSFREGDQIVSIPHVGGLHHHYERTA